jgi:NAD(P)-dependent dehydrogenase (short-subunit alcohol dehydrogenase family)
VDTDLTGRTALVTGANGGIGYWTSVGLARRGAHVVFGCRSAEKADAAVAALRGVVPHAGTSVLLLDLADLGSVRRAAETFAAGTDRLDLLINNAGIAMNPFSHTIDGFEAHFGTNFLGHFALTALLADTLRATPASRVVHVSSLQHRFARLHLDDPSFDHRRYFPWRGYGESKLAVLLFAHELDRRLRAVGSSTRSIGCHPGIAGTEIIEEMPVVGSPRLRPAARWVSDHLVPSPEAAATPILHAATAPDVVGGSYIGPSGRFGVRGAPDLARPSRRARSHEDAAALWVLAERMTGLRFDLT